MQSSAPITRWNLYVTPAIVIFIGAPVVCYFTYFTSIEENVAVVPKRATYLPVEVLTGRDTSYNMYGIGEIDANTDKNLHKFIRSMTSRQTPGEPRLAGVPKRRHYSQIGQSQLVDKLLKGRRNGVFLECGAADGVAFSNSLFFEMYRNWTGILIEANPTRLQSLIRQNRNAFVVRSCLSVTSKPQMAKFTMPRGVGGGLSDSLDNTDIKKFKKWSKSNVLPEIYVQCFPLMSIIEALDIHHIDYLSLDVEGPEIEILKAVDWTKLTVDVLTIEYNKSVDKLRKLRILFKNIGNYKEVRLMPSGSSDRGGQDVVFMRV